MQNDMKVLLFVEDQVGGSAQVQSHIRGCTENIKKKFISVKAPRWNITALLA